MSYVDGDYRDAKTYDSIKQRLADVGSGRPAHYLAIPPTLFPTVVEGLAKSGAAKNAREKPERGRRVAGIFVRHQRVMAGEDPRHAQQRSDLVQCTEHFYTFQPECMAAIPPDRLRYFTWSKPASPIAFAKTFCDGNRLMLSAR